MPELAYLFTYEHFLLQPNWQLANEFRCFFSLEEDPRRCLTPPDGSIRKSSGDLTPFSLPFPSDNFTTSEPMNIVILMTDTQPNHMVGVYSGNPLISTPHLDRLASQGVRFDRAYTTCPLCTPARSAFFSGLHAPVNGAWANSMGPGANIPLMGTVFSQMGYHCGYSGKWHLDGTSYFGDGQAGGGFAPEWWFDGKNYADFLGPDKFEKYRNCRTSEELRTAGFTRENIWGTQVADRAVDFLDSKKDAEQPFLLVASFDEPHGPYVTPPEYWEDYDESVIPVLPNFQAPLENKPALQQLHRSQVKTLSSEEHRHFLRRHYACNHFVDEEIGRVLDAVDRNHAGDTLVLYTSDHGDMQRSHGLTQKGPMMYEEAIRIPLIVRHPDGPSGVICDELVSHIDVFPTLLDLLGEEIPGILQGRSFLPQILNPETPGQDAVMVSFTRFGLNHDGWGGFYPIRGLVTRDHKLAVNLLDTDEFYDRNAGDHEGVNRIEDPAGAAMRDQLHDRLLAEMNRIRDPFRCAAWGNRAWRQAGTVDYYSGERRPRPSVFPFQAACIESDGHGSLPVSGPETDPGL